MFFYQINPVVVCTQPSSVSFDFLKDESVRYGSIDSNVIEIDTLLLSEVSAAPERKFNFPAQHDCSHERIRPCVAGLIVGIIRDLADSFTLKLRHVIPSSLILCMLPPPSPFS